MGNGNSGSTLPHFPERMLDQLLSFRIDIGSGFVQNQDFRLGCDGSGKGQKLSLATGEGGAAFSNRTIIALSALESLISRFPI